MKTCVIFARGGSTRIPNKNIKEFHGKPILSYSIQTALESQLFDAVYVDSDSDEILRIASEYGARVSKRPEHLGQNSVALASLTEYFLQTPKGRNVRDLCVLLPTAPLLSKETLSSAFLHYEHQRPRRGVISVCEYPYPAFRALRISQPRNKPELSFQWPEHEFSHSQDLEALYYDAGQFYILSAEYFNKHKKIFVPKAEPIILDRMKVCDIDTIDDWKEAEFKYKYLKDKGELQ